EKLAAYLTVLLKDYPEHGLMLSKFLFTEWTEVPLIFNVFNIGYSDGGSEWVIEYPSGWLTTTYPYEEFLAALDCMINKWGLPSPLVGLVRSKKKKLVKYVKMQKQKKD
ncbi:MAG: hypothetical protein WCQ50_19625, partial [Spirochaetota bacterium]